MPKNKETSFSTSKTRLALKAAAAKAPEIIKTHLAIKLSPYHALSDMQLRSSESGAGTYHRSGKHEQLKSKETDEGKSNSIHKNHQKDLERDNRTHIGAYNNNFQRLGDLAFDKKHKKAEKTSEGDASLYNHLLKYRQATCQKIVNELQHLEHIKVNYHHEYPCLMIHIQKSSVFTELHKPSTPALEAWAGFLLNYMLGAINASAKIENIPIEMVRRASFGFLSPTLAPTDESIRLNVGIIPEAYMGLIVTTLLKMDNMLGKLKNEIANTLIMPDDHWFKSEKFRKYRSKKANHPLQNLVQLLWEPVDNGNQTTLQNIMRTAHAQDGIHKIVFEALSANPDDDADAMKRAISWSIDQLALIKGKLSCKQSDDISFKIKFNKKTVTDISDDHDFWQCIDRIHENILKLPSKITMLNTALTMIKTAHDEGELYHLYAKLEALQDAMLIQAGYQAEALAPEDGYGSDSEEEYEFDDKKIHARKIIVSNGMRSILCALIGASLDKKALDVFIDKAYYEVPAGLDLMKPVNGITVKRMTKPSEASITMIDATPCITNGKPQKKITLLKEEERTQVNNSIMIVDITSATTDAMNSYVKAFAASRSPLLCLVGSGTKNEQFGADANSYGTIRFFSKNTNTIDEALRTIHTLEDPIRSPISHQHRRLMKAAGAVPTNKAILRRQ